MSDHQTHELREQLAAQKAAFDREQRWHRIAMQVAKIGTWTRDMRTNVVEWSPELAELFGLTPDQAPRSSEAFMELVHPHDRARFQEEVGAAMRSQSDYHFDFRYRHSS